MFSDTEKSGRECPWSERAIEINTLQGFFSSSHPLMKKREEDFLSCSLAERLRRERERERGILPKRNKSRFSIIFVKVCLLIQSGYFCHPLRQLVVLYLCITIHVSSTFKFRNFDFSFASKFWIPKRERMNNDQDFVNKIVIVTGSSSGIGEDAVISFARAGAQVVVTGKRLYIFTALSLSLCLSLSVSVSLSLSLYYPFYPLFCPYNLAKGK